MKFSRDRGLSASLEVGSEQPEIGASSAGTTLTKLLALLREYGIILILIVLTIVSDVLYPGFFAWANIRNLLSQNTALGVVALGMTFVMISGAFDLSAGAVVGAGAIVAAEASGAGLVVAALAAVGVGLAAGCINGSVVNKLRVNPFIATLGTGYLFTGAITLYAGPNTIFVTNSSLISFGSGFAVGLPYTVWFLVAVVVLAAIALGKTIFGRRIYSVGGNAEASRLAGIAVNRISVYAYLVSGVCAALAGVCLCCIVQSAQVTTGSNLTFDAITAVVIGGTSLFGGEGSIWRTVVGVLILATLQNLFNSLGLSSALQSLVEGAILIAAVSANTFLRLNRT